MFCEADRCEICQGSRGAEDADGLCPVCTKAVADAQSQQRYLTNLRSGVVPEDGTPDPDGS